MRLNECQIILIDLNFTAKNVSKFFIKIQLTNSNLKIIRGVNPPCLMPIRIKVEGLLFSQLTLDICQDHQEGITCNIAK